VQVHTITSVKNFQISVQKVFQAHKVPKNAVILRGACTESAAQMALIQVYRIILGVVNISVICHFVCDFWWRDWEIVWVLWPHINSKIFTFHAIDKQRIALIEL